MTSTVDRTREHEVDGNGVRGRVALVTLHQGNIDISSVIDETGNIGQANCAASSAGLFGLTKSLALEAAFQLKRAGRLDDGIGLTVNTVAPGFIATETLSTDSEKVLDGIRAQVPLGRLGQLDEIARAVCLLAADESAYITGQTFAVNGGLDM